jgi:uncharacterized protein (TIGR00369 family)
VSPPIEEKLQEVRDRIRAVSPPAFAGALGIELVDLKHGAAVVKMTLSDHHLLHSGGLIHAGSVFGLADTAAGWGCLASLPAGVGGFTTIEGKANLTASAARGDVLTATAVMVHGGRSTQVWDVHIHRARGDRPVGLYRCTQMLLAAERNGTIETAS